MSSDSASTAALSQKATLAELTLGVGRPPVANREDYLLEPAQTFGNFRIVRPLGKGGMGEVYEAVDERSGRTVALKVMTRGLESDRERKRFLREGRLAAQISHPNSVYLFGTEIVDDVPVMAMELLPGGTLQEVVEERAPLPPQAAVDAIRQVIAGLLAAHSRGILHRDIKPSNCLLDERGEIKIGDYGLSISTGPQAETRLTVHGGFLGTPAYASPEQLGGEELDLRSDLYAVGGTLYYLLTGQTPFEADNLVQLTTKVVKERPRSPRELRKEVPPGLSEAVMRCLAKDRGERFSDYTALANALLTFGSEAPMAARPGVRLLAGLFDGVLLISTWVALVMTMSVLGVLPAAVERFGSFVCFGGYFVVSEGLWGASAGKILCGLRVVRTTGERANLLRVAARFALLLVVLLALSAPAPVFGPLLQWITLMLLPLLFPMILFSTARRRNGYACLHDLASGTRVVVKSAAAGESRSATTEDSSTPRTEETVGPFQVIATLGPNARLGYDPDLRRRVWIRHCPAPAAGIVEQRRDLARPARVRWLAGRRSHTESWDAYEALEGAPLLPDSAPLQRHSWGRTRGWLMTLAGEIDAGLKDQSLPHLALDRVWITEHGEAKLLDWPAPGAEVDPAGDRDADQADLAGSQTFLSRVSMAALEGRSVTRPDTPRAPLPLGARGWLEDLARGAFESSSALLETVGVLVARPSSVSRRRRFASLAVFLLPATLSIAFLIPSLHHWWLKWRFPDIAELGWAMRFLERQVTPYPDGRLESLEIYLADRYAPTIVAAGRSPETTRRLLLGLEGYHRAEELLRNHPASTPDEVAAAATVWEVELSSFLSTNSESSGSVVFVAGRRLDLSAPFTSSIYLGLASMLFAGANRRGPVLRALGIAIVTGGGELASRWRCLGRAAAAWLPIMLLVWVWIGTGHLLALALLLSASLIGIGWALRRPERGLQDHVAGTYLVPD